MKRRMRHIVNLLTDLEKKEFISISNNLYLNKDKTACFLISRNLIDSMIDKFEIKDKFNPIFSNSVKRFFREEDEFLIFKNLVNLTHQELLPERLSTTMEEDRLRELCFVLNCNSYTKLAQLMVSRFKPQKKQPSTSIYFNLPFTPENVILSSLLRNAMRDIDNKSAKM